MNKLANILREIGNPKCLSKLENLENDESQITTLNLRSLDLRPKDIFAIADLLKQDKGILKSISFSYNNLMGNEGAIVLAKSLPSSIREIGLVDCGIGDKGGTEILKWMETSSNLRMICMEQNVFSATLKMELNFFKKKNPSIMIVF